ncbi:cag pathogenicity island protein Cag5 [Polaromonas sp.]|nr:cag pathogenicity island protein Cag5 [Polaromonas sp.]
MPSIEICQPTKVFVKHLPFSLVFIAAALVGCASNPASTTTATQAEAEPTQMASTPTESCKAISAVEVAALFDRWNHSLQSGDAKQVVANYAVESILLPTTSNKPRLTPAEKLDYFQHFLKNKPTAKIDLSVVQIDCNTASDAGMYTFRFAKGAAVKGRYSYTYRWDGSDWLITSHHSSAMPEKK